MVTSCLQQSRTEEDGFAYLAVLVAIAILGLGLTGASEVWETTARRQKLAETEWRGSQYVKAVASYYESTPGLAKTYPASIAELLEDRRFANPRHHLREAYVNPVLPNGGWQLITGDDQRIRGVQTTLPWDKNLVLRWRYPK